MTRCKTFEPSSRWDTQCAGISSDTTASDAAMQAKRCACYILTDLRKAHMFPAASDTDHALSSCSVKQSVHVMETAPKGYTRPRCTVAREVQAHDRRANLPSWPRRRNHSLHCLDLGLRVGITELSRALTSRRM